MDATDPTARVRDQRDTVTDRDVSQHRTGHDRLVTATADLQPDEPAAGTDDPTARQDLDVRQDGAFRHNQTTAPPDRLYPAALDVDATEVRSLDGLPDDDLAAALDRDAV